VRISHSFRDLTRDRQTDNRQTRQPKQKAPTLLNRGIITSYTHTHNCFTALWNLSGKTRVSRYQKKHSPTQHTSWSPIIPICFLHLARSMASSLFNPRALQSFSTISLQVFFGVPLGLVPSTSYSTHFFTQSLSSFRSTCPYHRNLFCCSTEIMSSNSSLPLKSQLFTWNSIL